MNEVKILVEKRVPARKGTSKKMRSEGVIPAVIYGQGGAAIPISLSNREFGILYKNNLKQAIYNIDLDGKVIPTLIKELQRDKVDESVLHIDFFEFDGSKETNFLVPVTTIGEAPGVITGGILSIVKNEVWVRALPLNIPTKIEVDISELELGKSVRIKDKTNDMFELLSNPNDPLVSILVPRGIDDEEEEEGEEGAEGEAAATPAATDGKPAEAAKPEAKK